MPDRSEKASVTPVNSTMTIAKRSTVQLGDLRRYSTIVIQPRAAASPIKIHPMITIRGAKQLRIRAAQSGTSPADHPVLENLAATRSAERLRKLSSPD
jgi:hypothetical protein